MNPDLEIKCEVNGRSVANGCEKSFSVAAPGEVEGLKKRKKSNSLWMFLTLKEFFKNRNDQKNAPGCVLCAGVQCDGPGAGNSRTKVLL